MREKKRETTLRHLHESIPSGERILKVTKKSGNRGRCRKLSLFFFNFFFFFKFLLFSQRKVGTL